MATDKIRESFGERDTPARLHALGIQQLLAGRYDDAAESLQSAARERPDNARYLNDVAAVQLERARVGLRPDDLPRALASADRARRLDPSLREAWFNRALAVTALSLTDQARVAWGEYLDRDGSSPWAAEARTRLAGLAGPTPAAAWDAMSRRLDDTLDPALADAAVRLHMTEARHYLEATLLPAWSRAVLAGQSGAAERERLRLMGDAFLRAAGDALYRDVVGAIDRAETQGPVLVRRLAAAHAQYAAAAQLFEQDLFAEAAVALVGARESLAASDPAFASRAALDLGAALYFQSRADDASRLLDGLAQTVRGRGYPHVDARIAWQRGLIAFGQGRLGDAQAHYEETLAAYERIGDAEQIAAANNLLASLHLYLGSETVSWRYRQQALQGLSVTRSDRLQYGLLVGAATALGRQDLEAALAFQDAAIGAALRWGREVAVAEARSTKATILFNLGRTAEAEAELAGARTALDSIPDSPFRRRIEVSILSAESDIVRQTDPARAAAAAQRAIKLVDERRDRRRLAQLNLRLARANIVWGRLDAAQTALARGIQVFEDERASLSDEGRLSTLDESWQLLETSAQLSIRKGDYARAFDITERARLRTLAEANRAGAGRSLAAVQAGLTGNEAVLALSQFDDEVAVWVIRRGRVEVTTRPITRRNAARLVARQQDEIRHEARTPAASRELFNELIRPVAASLAGATRLVVVPDAAYEAASFAAFWDVSRRRFLVEDFRISRAASVAAFAASLEAPRAERDGDPLILGGPLPSANAAVAEVASAYDSSDRLVGAAATRSQFFAGAPGRRVVHVAAQTAENAVYPLLSRLILADEPGQPHSGGILGRDIAAGALLRTGVVVIDQVSPDGSPRSDGTASLARAFMTAGVPAVLGTLPGADEAAARDLMVDFHRRLASDMAAVDALTQLQRNVLQSNGHRLGAWCALVLYGSDR